MPRLIDDIRNAGKMGMPWYIARGSEESWKRHTINVLGILQDPSIPVLCIDNVAEYLYAGTDQENWDLGRDFPNLAPPFPIFWCEHRLVRHIRSTAGDTDVTKLLPQGGRVGHLFIAAERDQFKGEGIPDEAKWVVWCELFADYHKPEVTADGSHGSIFMCIDAEGRLIERPWMQSWSDPIHNDMLKNVMAWLNPSLLAISFLHCKNVTMIDNPVPPKLARRYKQRHPGAPGLTAHKTLVIEPLKQILRTQGRSGEVGLAKAMHICRGHFRDYRQGPGLFGKYKQLVWTPSVIRGTKGKSAPAREIEVKL